MTRTGTYLSNVVIKVNGSWVGTPIIPLENADSYTIGIIEITEFGGSNKPVFGWDIKKYKNGFNLEKNNGDMVYYFTVHKDLLWTVKFKVS